MSNDVRLVFVIIARCGQYIASKFDMKRRRSTTTANKSSAALIPVENSGLPVRALIIVIIGQVAIVDPLFTLRIPFLTAVGITQY